MPEEPAADRVGDDRALVADDRIGDPGRLGVRPHRPEHPARHQHHVDPRVERGADRRPRPRPQLGVLPDQGAIDVAGERPDTARKAVGEDYFPATDETYAATSAICFGVSCPLNEGITPLPLVTRSTTRAAGGIFWSRFGPTVPFAPASFRVWQLVQPDAAKTVCRRLGLALDRRRHRDLADHRLRGRRGGRTGRAARECEAATQG